MLMFTRIPTRSKCMWGSRVGVWKRGAGSSRVAGVYLGRAGEDNAPGRGGGSGGGEGAVEGLGEIGDQVVGVLDADREANQVVLDADLEPLLAAELVEAHDRGLLDQALDSAQRGRDERDRARVHHPGRRVEIARDLEGDHTAEAAHLLAGDRVLGVGRETRV